jgi:hypothetical protein
VWKIQPFREFLGVSNDRHLISEDLTDAQCRKRPSICALATHIDWTAHKNNMCASGKVTGAAGRATVQCSEGRSES